MGPGGELRLGIGVIVISGIKQNCIVPIMNNKSVQKKDINRMVTVLKIYFVNALQIRIFMDIPSQLQICFNRVSKLLASAYRSSLTIYKPCVKEVVEVV